MSGVKMYLNLNLKLTISTQKVSPSQVRMLSSLLSLVRIGLRVLILITILFRNTEVRHFPSGMYTHRVSKIEIISEGTISPSAILSVIVSSYGYGFLR